MTRAARHMDAVPISRFRTTAYTVPTESPESDGTFAWEATTAVVVEAEAGGKTGLGYSYTHAAAAHLIAETLAPRVEGRDALAVQAAWHTMNAEVRNLGRPGLASTAIAAVDTALWDLKARLLGVPLVVLLGPVRDAMPVYGSGGFTSYSVERLGEQLAGWVEDGITMVKMKVGREPEEDLARVEAAREAIGDEATLFVDANGAYDRKEALAFAEAFADVGVSWFEEPVSSDDLDGLRLLRDRAPAGMDVTAGEYGYDAFYFRRMLEAGAVDVLQADATRCAGYAGYLAAAVLCDAHHIPLSAHTAPNLHAHIGCATAATRHVEYFFDHVRLECLLFDGALEAEDGALRPDRSRPGHGLTLKHADAAPYQVFGD